MSITVSDEDLLEIAKRSKGTPRILNARLLWYKSFIAYNKLTKVSVDEVFVTQGIDGKGMDSYDRMYLEVLAKNRMNPLGIKSLSSMTGIAVETIENSIEPYMIRKGYAIRTQKGRVLGKLD